jgi:hypothetical protein
MQNPKQARIIQRERAIVIEYDDEAIATQMFDSFIAKVNGTDISDEWISLTEAVGILNMTRKGLYNNILKCESDRINGKKTKWKIGKHYRKCGGTRWEVNCKEIISRVG